MFERSNYQAAQLVGSVLVPTFSRIIDKDLTFDPIIFQEGHGGFFQGDPFLLRLSDG